MRIPKIVVDTLFLTGLSAVFLMAFFVHPTFAATTDPNGIIQQATNADNPNCKDITSPTPQPNCGGQGVPVDVFPYVVPCTTAGCKVSPYQSYVFMNDGTTHVVNDSLYSLQDGYVVQHFDSEQKHLLYKVSGDTIQLLQDTSWANAQKCDGTTTPALQKIVSGSSPGGNMLKRNMGCGVPYAQTGSNVAYSYSLTEEDNLQKSPTYTSALVKQCDNPNAGPLSGGSKVVIYKGKAVCGDWSGNMISVWNMSGKGAGEVYMYCEGKGLCAFYESIDWTHKETQPQNWKEDTDLCNGFQDSYCNSPKRVPGVSNPHMTLTFAQRVALSIAQVVGSIVNVAPEVHPFRPQSGDAQKKIDYERFYNGYLQTSRDLTPGNAQVVIPGRLSAQPASGNEDFVVVGNTNPQKISIASNICYPTQNSGPNDQLTSLQLVKSSDENMKNLIAVTNYQGALIAADHGLDPNRTGASGKPYIKLETDTTLLPIADKYQCSEDNQVNQIGNRQNDSTGENPYVNGNNLPATALNTIAKIANVILGGINPGPTGVPTNGPATTKQGDAGAQFDFPSRVNYGGLDEAIAHTNVLTNSGLPQQIIDLVPKNKNGFVQGDYLDPFDQQRSVQITAQNYKTTEDYQSCYFAGGFPGDIQSQYNIACGTAGTGVDTTAKVAPADLDYAIDIHANCVPSDAAIAAMSSRLSTQRLNGKFDFESATMRSTNFDQFVHYIISHANGVNPGFLIAQWIEESAASGYLDRPTQAFGCGGDAVFHQNPIPEPLVLTTGSADKSSKVAAHIDRQLSCIINETIANVVPSSDPKRAYLNYLCRFGGIGGSKNYVCDASDPDYSRIPGIANRLKTWYDALGLGDCGVTH